MQGPSRSLSRWFLPLLICSVYFLPATKLLADESRLFALRSLKNLSLPLGDEVSQPTAFFRCGSVTTDKRRVGIFQLGLHPRWVFKDVKLELTAHGSARKGMEDVAKFFSAEPFLRGGRIDGLVITNQASGATASAQNAELAGPAEEQFLLLQGVTMERNPASRSFSAVGRLLLTGPNAGRVIAGPNENLTIDLAE